MDLMAGIASAATAMSTMEFQQNYTISVAKKAMESQELAAQELLRMLPPGDGKYLDVYA